MLNDFVTFQFNAMNTTKMYFSYEKNIIFIFNAIIHEISKHWQCYTPFSYHPSTWCKEISNAFLMSNCYKLLISNGFIFIREKEITTLRIYQYWKFYYTVIETGFEMLKSSEHEKLWCYLSYKSHNILDCSEVF